MRVTGGHRSGMCMYIRRTRMARTRIITRARWMACEECCKSIPCSPVCRVLVFLVLPAAYADEAKPARPAARAQARHNSPRTTTCIRASRTVVDLEHVGIDRVSVSYEGRDRGGE